MDDVSFVKKDTMVNKKLYKYFSNLDHAENAIKTKQIHFEKVSTYNDIFDGSYAMTADTIVQLHNGDNNSFKLVLDILKKTNYKPLADLLDTKEYDEKYKSFNNLGEVIEEVYKELKVRCPTNATKKESFITAILKCFGGKKRTYPDNISCSCFSEVNDSLLMWSYYADKHSGICLEYDLCNQDAKIDKIVKHISQVVYTTNYCDMWNNLETLFTKSLQWNHEQEWRVVCDIQDKEYLDFPYISAIYLGARMSEDNIQRFTEIAATSNLKIYQMASSLCKYELTTERIGGDNQ